VISLRGAVPLCNLLLRGDPARVMRCAIKHILLVPGLKYFVCVEESTWCCYSI